MHAPLRVFAPLVLVASVVAPSLSTPLGYVFGPSKLAYQLIRSSALLTWLIGIWVTQLLHVVLNQRRPTAGMGQFAARILMRAAADRKKKRTGNALIMKLKVVNFGDIL